MEQGAQTFETLIEELLLLVRNNMLDAFFNAVFSGLSKSTGIYNELVSIQSRHTRTESEWRKGSITWLDYDRSCIQINNSVLDILNKSSPEQFNIFSSSNKMLVKEGFQRKYSPPEQGKRFVGKIKQYIELDAEIIDIGVPNKVQLYGQKDKVLNLHYGPDGFGKDRIGQLIIVRAKSVNKKGEVISIEFIRFK